MKIKHLNSNVNGYAVSASHYKNVVMAIRFFAPLEKLNNTKTALLAQLIKDRNIHYPSKSKMQTLKDDLYGASISSRSFGYGPTQVLETRISCIVEDFVTEPLQSIQLSTLTKLIYEPLINEETLKEAKRTITNSLIRSQENPMNFSLLRTFEILGENSSLGINTQGNIQDLKNISVEDMLDFHQEFISNTPVQLVIVGKFKEELLNLVDQEFRKHPRIAEKPLFNLYSSVHFKNAVETKQITQASLIEAFQSGISIEHPLYFAYRIGNVILGQLPTSFLFQEVREKNSLAYSVSSRLIVFEGLLLVTTSLDHRNIEKANSLILEQVNKIKTGRFSQQQIEAAITMMIASLDSIFDDEFSLVNFIFDSAYRQLSFDIDQHKQNYLTISKEMIVESFKAVEHIFQYVLKGEEND